MNKVVIIGGQAAGCKAAARLKRIMPDSEITIVEKREILSFGACGMPFYASGDIPELLELATTPYGMVRDAEFFRDVKGVEARIHTEATAIDTSAQTVSCRDLMSGEEFELGYDNLIIATGGRTSRPPFPCPESERISTFIKPADAKAFRKKAQTGQVGTAVVIGGGYIGCELAEALVSLWGIDTHIVEMEDRLLPKAFDGELAGLIAKVYEDEGVNLHLRTRVEKVELDDDGNPTVSLNSGESIDCDYVFIATGIMPDTRLARSAGVRIGDRGGIAVDNQMRTNIANIFAAGDCIEINNYITGKPCLLPLGSLANRQGRVAADAIAGRDANFGGAVGAISMKAFELITASTGLTEKLAGILGYECSTIVGNWTDRPDYYPENHDIYAKLVYERETLRLLGLQLVGRGEVTRYIDSFTQMAAAEGTLYDLLDAEHAYTPPHSGPLNPLNNLAAMALNQEEGIRCIEPGEIDKFEGLVIDVREESEIEAYPLERADEKISIKYFREKASNLDTSRPVLVVCQRGPRSYEAARWLNGRGASEVAYLGGGMQLAEKIIS